MSKKISILFVIIIALITGLWAWSVSANQNHVVLGGSTSVNTFMQSYTKDFLENEKKDFIYNSTGSQAGVGGVEKGMYGAGFISKDVSNTTLTGDNQFVKVHSGENEKEGYTFSLTEKQKFIDKITEIKNENKNTSKNKSYLAFEFALDAIAIIYKKPDWLTDDSANKINFSLDKKDFANTSLGKIYSNNYTWEELAKEVGQENVPNSSTKIVSFTREDGSGTRSAFGDLTGIKSMEYSNVVNSNGAMFENVQKSQTAIGYISYAFVKQITKESGVKVAGVKNTKLGNPADLGNDDWEYGMKLNKATNSFEKTDVTNEQFIKATYGFKRPFIAIFNIHYKNLNLLIDFFSAMIGEDDTNPYRKNFVEEGLVPNFIIRKVDYEIK
ncbi:phosphate ABC transporter substrate-binding protein [Spiroplasma gladiatoris]|uniref:Phosphate ABC transporter substrate-binding protein n=1 Tax=Spiroplasma gladiatoris TaxID=2143 RepID=A0A4P7AJS4_9MOLU|nr:phosphate ABC transporter substrate-binding protein [Spiroplasma gladiatoris]QBQ08003.1 phosphate ABC transporter substrate-binding protein [Spiroplasma gladiatoris]